MRRAEDQMSLTKRVGIRSNPIGGNALLISNINNATMNLSCLMPLLVSDLLQTVARYAVAMMFLYGVRITSNSKGKIVIPIR